MKKYYFLLIVSGLFVLSSCKKEKEEVSNNNSPVSSVDKNKLLQLVNNLRSTGCNCGSTFMPPVSAVTWNDILEQTSFLHSKDMEQNNYFSHTSLDGKNPGQRLTAAGYNWLAYAENIAKGYSTEETVIEGWKNSEGHCKNMMNGNLTEMGVGKSGAYWTQLFGKR